MTQISKGEAISNFSSWIPEKYAPEWLKNPQADEYIFYGAIGVSLLVLVFPTALKYIQGCLPTKHGKLLVLHEEGKSLLGESVPVPMYANLRGYNIKNLKTFERQSKAWAKKTLPMASRLSPALGIKFGNPPPEI